MADVLQDGAALLICGNCNKVFLKQSYLIDHLKQHVDAAFQSASSQHKELFCDEVKASADSLNPIVCSLKVDVCPATFASSDQNQRIPESIILHKEKLSQNENVFKLLLSKAYTRFPNKRAFECGICGRHYRFRQAACDHANAHTSEKPYKCRYCSHHSTSLGARRQHEQRLHLQLQPGQRSMISDSYADAAEHASGTEKCSDIDDNMYDSSDESSDAANQFGQSAASQVLKTADSQGLQLPTQAEEYSPTQTDPSNLTASKEPGELASPKRKSSGNSSRSRSTGRARKTPTAANMIGNRIPAIRHSCNQCPLQFTDAALLVKHMMFHRQFAQNGGQHRNRPAGVGAGATAQLKQTSTARPVLTPHLPSVQTVQTMAGRMQMPHLSTLGQLAGTVPTSLALPQSSCSLTSTQAPMVSMSNAQLSLQAVTSSSAQTPTTAATAAAQGFYLQRSASLMAMSQQQQQQQLSQTTQQPRFYRPMFAPILPPQFGHFSTMPPVAAPYFGQGAPFFMQARPNMTTLQQQLQQNQQQAAEEQNQQQSAQKSNHKQQQKQKESEQQSPSTHVEISDNTLVNETVETQQNPVLAEAAS